MSITSGDKVFYYMVRDSLCFLTMTESRYPKRLAFLYLDEVGDLVLQELIREFGNNVSTLWHIGRWFLDVVHTFSSFGTQASGITSTDDLS
jgi:hypothetical protein